MKFGRVMLGLLAPLALGAFVAVVPEMSGSATGRWKQVDAYTSTVNATLFGMKAEPLFAFKARLYGRDSGDITGTIVDLPQRPVLEDYRFVGTYARQKDGRVQVDGMILRDAPGTAVVGVLRGALDPNPGKSPMGHFHARWEFR
jgi:hypothetical protein